MMKLKLKEMFHTSLGLKMAVEKPDQPLSVGDEVSVNGKNYTVKGIILPPDTSNNFVVVTV